MRFHELCYRENILHMALKEWPLAIISSTATIPLSSASQRLDVHPNPKEQDGFSKTPGCETFSLQIAHDRGAAPKQDHRDHPNDANQFHTIPPNHWFTLAQSQIKIL
ncbi:hypothetical protein HRbin07_00387 [bacterium HR07]|nr:hypothetical protein HRbin07_00387 [bacterium HR07]